MRSKASSSSAEIQLFAHRLKHFFVQCFDQCFDQFLGFVFRQLPRGELVA